VLQKKAVRKKNKKMANHYEIPNWYLNALIGNVKRTEITPISFSAGLVNRRLDFTLM
jgi:hypothetical protein